MKKLSFNKQTIANLDSSELNHINGGYTSHEDCTEDTNICASTIPSRCNNVLCHFTVDYPCNSMGEYCTYNDCLWK
ncbi:MAG: class I lanthipeptide [Hyphomicrobiales bacterium]